MSQVTDREKRYPAIVVVGAGYVGLATAVFLAYRGQSVTVLEKDDDRIKLLRRGRLHFREKQLQEKLKATLEPGRIRIESPSQEAYVNADFVFIAIDSADPETGKMKLDVFDQMARWIGSSKLRPNYTVILKSTNVIGFAEAFEQMLLGYTGGRNVRVLVNPEFLREGCAYEDTANPWRIVIGARDSKSASGLVKLLRSVYRKTIPIVVTDFRSAELIKLGSNVYLSHRLAYVHELADFARLHGLDMDAIRRGMGLDPRIGESYFEPGLGFGGSCLPKDCRLINASQLDGNFQFKAARTALEINERVLDNLVHRMQSVLGNLQGRKVAQLGVAFKPEVDDIRSSQAVKLALKLQSSGARVVCHDPFLKNVTSIKATSLLLEGDLRSTLDSAAALVIGTAHKRFRSLKPDLAATLMSGKVVCDYFGILNRNRWTRKGFRFV